VTHAQYLDHLGFDLIDHDVRRASDDQLARAINATDAPAQRNLGQRTDFSGYDFVNARGRRRIIRRDVSVGRLEIAERRLEPPYLRCVLLLWLRPRKLVVGAESAQPLDRAFVRDERPAGIRLTLALSGEASLLFRDFPDKRRRRN